jgi:hypothetical protein
MKRIPPVALALLAAARLALAQQYDHGNPTNDEQLVLEIINRARANPDAEGARLSTVSFPLNQPIPGGNIREGMTLSSPSLVGPRPPLAFNPQLIAAARAHSTDMWTRNFFSHDTEVTSMSPAPPLMAGDTFDLRISRFGYSGNRLAENIATGSAHSAANLEDLLMIDREPSPYPERGHRRNLLDIADPVRNPYREIGLGFFDFGSNKSGILRDVITQDFGRRNSVGPFIVGVVYDDLSPTPFYTPGEGRAGVTVTQTGSQSGQFAVTSASGGYAIPTGTAGTITVSATGGPLGSTVLTRNVTLTGENVKVDFAIGVTVTIAATDPNASEAGLATGTFTVTRAGGTAGDLTVNYTVSGNASSGADYAALPGSVVIPDGQASATITLTPLQDTLVEGPETVVVTLAGGSGYAVMAPSSDTVTIADDDVASPGDADGDGLTDTQEASLGTNPNDPDSDNDGMSDGAEVQWSYNPLSADQNLNGVTDGLDDWNGDGTNNQTEAALGQNPGTAPPPPPPREEEDRCGATGGEALLLVALRRRRRTSHTGSTD